MTMKFSETPSFLKELKSLARKYRSLQEDLKEFRKVITKYPLGTGKHFTVLHVKEDIKIIKARLFCKYLKGASLRIIYAFHEDKGLIEFIELYFKGDKETEDKERIKGYIDLF